MQGIFIGGRRPKSKADIKRYIADNGPDRVKLEATSMFGNEYGGPIGSAPAGKYTFVGPDPYRDRRFYGTLVVTDEHDIDGNRKVVVK